MNRNFFRIWVPIISLLFVNVLYAQQRILATGVLLSKGSDNRIGAASIVNLKNGLRVQSNDLGIFTINAKIGDTLQISKENFAAAQVLVSSEDAMIIRMYQNEVTTLQQVDVYGDSKIKGLKETQKEYLKQGSFYNGKPPILSVIFSPITGFYELFGKGPRNARKYNNYLNSEIQQGSVDAKFNRYLIEKYTPLKGEEVGNFMFRYRPDYKLSRNWNTYQIIDYIKKRYQVYEQERKSGKYVDIPDLNQIKP